MRRRARQTVVGLTSLVHACSRPHAVDTRIDLIDITDRLYYGKPLNEGTWDVYAAQAASIWPGCAAQGAMAYLAALAGDWDAVGAAYAAGTKLREGLNSLTDGGFDRLIQRLLALHPIYGTIIHLQGQATNEAGRLAREMEFLRRHGIDPTGLSAEEVSAKVDELGKHGGAAASPR